MRVLLTGADGFLGWHVRLRCHALTSHDVRPVGRGQWASLSDGVRWADAVIHLAGVNRGDDHEVEAGNLALAEDLARCVDRENRPIRVVFANSVHSVVANPYGRGKAAAAARLREAADRAGGEFVDVLLPNIFGERGRPRYNSFVATFVEAVMTGQRPTIVDRQVPLLHAQDAAQFLLDGLAGSADDLTPPGHPIGVQEVHDLLMDFASSYADGTFPELTSRFRVNLFNTYRAALFPTNMPIRLVSHTDHRGTFVETVKCQGGSGQTSYSTTVPGETRGEHYHLSKIERFSVIQGDARISLRRMFSSDVVDFQVSGDRPVAIDMPMGWVHNIVNTGSEPLVTQFWAHEVFDPDAPDTFFEKVRTDVEVAR